MKQVKWASVWLTVLTAAVGMALTGCAGKGLTPKDAPPQFLCAVNNNVEMDIEGAVQLEDFSCSFKKYEGAEYLHFGVTLKNLSDKPQRYRVNIFLDDDRAVGGLIPQSTSKGLVQPGKTASFTYPVKGATRQPQAVMLKIRPVN
jgi:hypothetical protein